MTVLIVDDQRSVLDGLLSGVRWETFLVENVLTACNALEAKAILARHKVDIVLCDIEMPVESGMDLFRWVKEKGLLPYFIFLTSHAEFSYAQEAIRLGAADYVIQPALYSEIERAVEKGVQTVGCERERTIMLSHGKVFTEQKKLFAGNAVRNLLKNRLNSKEWDSLAGMQLLPQLGKNGSLVMIQIIRWNTAPEKWETNLLEVSLENIVNELLAAYNQVSALASVEENLFAVLLQGQNGEQMSQQDLLQQLQFLCSVCAQYFRCDIACYFDRPCLLEDAAERWADLLNKSEANVLRKAGIFPHGEASAGTEHRYSVPQVKHWHALLKDGYPQTVEREALDFLAQLSEQGKMDQLVLRNFYQDFMQMLYATLEDEEQNLRDFFRTTAEMELYRNGMKSVQQMGALIRFVTVHYESRTREEDTKAVVPQVIDYIADHLEDELRRDEIAERVHLNRDYLSRVFRKETGLSLKEYITEQKMKASQGLLQTTDLPISFVGAKMGYCNSSHFSYTYKKVMGKTPQEERQEGRAP